MSSCVDFFQIEALSDKYPTARRDFFEGFSGVTIADKFYLPVHTEPVCYITVSPITVDGTTRNRKTTYEELPFILCATMSLPTIEQHKQLYSEYPGELLRYYEVEWLRHGAAILGSGWLYLDRLNSSVHGDCKGVYRLCIRL